MPPARPPAVVVPPCLARSILTPFAAGLAPLAGGLALANFAGAQTISNGTISVEVNKHGVLVSVPPKGLHTYDGPRVLLAPGTAEWFGVMYDGPGGHVERSGSGLAPDWAGRPAVDPVSLEADLDSAVVIARAGDLEVRHDFAFDPAGGYLLAGVTLRNLAGTTLINVVYSREWRTGGGAGFTFPVDLGLPRGPGDVARVAYMTDDIPAGESRGINWSYEEEGRAAPETVNVPLVLWTHPSFPAGLDFGACYGMAIGDYDGDGWFDACSMQSQRLWRNVDGTTWQLVSSTFGLASATYRYSASFGDYDDSGLPDIATEPRNSGSGDHCAHLLRNLGGGPVFQDVGVIPAIIGLQACGDAETACWGDVDGDARLDLFLPVYPPWAFGSPGNFFHWNRGPVGPGGASAFLEQSALAGLDNPPNSARPEGAQFVDCDGDGDMDLYSNGTVYQNRSFPGTADFDALSPAASGVTLQTQLDEGGAFFDYDLDGDQDLVIVYTSNPGAVIWENRGDGSFFQVEAGVIDSPLTGLNLGLSYADWDDDGDIDFTTRQVFRRNDLVETGQRHFSVAPHSISSTHITSATPCWGDWDKDGDLDSVLANWSSTGHFYLNNLYGPATPVHLRRSIRVRPVRDHEGFPDGLDTEFGAIVEVRPLSGGGTWRRRSFCSSSGGYLNQNEYAVHLALPPHPDPAHPEQDLHFDVSVDFPGPPSLGYTRVDKRVNYRLGAIPLAALADREIRVFRSGKVILDGWTYAPHLGSAPTKLVTTAGGLILAGANTPLPAPTPGAGNQFVGIEIDTLGATSPRRIEEILLDGQLAVAVNAPGGSFNVALWDVTVAGKPFLLERNRIATSTYARNRRHSLPCDLVLEPGRVFRLVARVTEYRPTPIPGPIDHQGLLVRGGLLYTDANPISGAGVAGAGVNPTNVYLSARCR